MVSSVDQHVRVQCIPMLILSTQVNTTNHADMGSMVPTKIRRFSFHDLFLISFVDHEEEIMNH